MRKIKIVTDSSANILALSNVAFSFAPLKIVTSETEFVDTESLNVEEMVDYFDAYKGKSRTSCPAPADWLQAFGDADDILCITITGNLSGSYSSACVAKNLYETEHRDKRVYVIDSLSAGPEMALMIEKANELAAQGKSFEELCDAVQAYTQTTGLLFMLESLKNFAANGRVCPAVAKITGLLGIRVVGKASDKGELEPLNKCRGEKHALEKLFDHLKKLGLSRGKVRIVHCRNADAAQNLKDMIHKEMPAVDVAIDVCRGLCSYYAETGGMLVGFEKR